LANPTLPSTLAIGVSFTKGRIIVRGKLVSRDKARRANYVLYSSPTSRWRCR